MIYTVNPVKKPLFAIIFTLVMTMGVFGQQLADANRQQPSGGASEVTANPIAKSGASTAPTGYLLRSGDQVRIYAFHVDEIPGNAIAIDESGFVDLPMVGRIKAAGSSVFDLATAIKQKLQIFVKDPQVSVELIGLKSTTILLAGAFRNPGPFEVKDQRSLLDVIAAAGGFTPEAGGRLKIVRHLEYGFVPLAGATVDPGGKTTSVSVSVSPGSDLREAATLTICPSDIITAEKGEVVYVTGEVSRVGIISMGERRRMPVTELVTMAGGLNSQASRSKAIILRPVPNTTDRRVITVDLTKVFMGKAEDITIEPKDLLYVPNRGNRSAWLNGALISTSIVATILNLALR